VFTSEPQKHKGSADGSPRRGGTLRFAAALALVVIIIAIAVYLVVLSDLQRALRWRLDKLQAAGIPTNWSQLAPPPIPDKDNAAIIYEQAFKSLSLTTPRRGLSDRECLHRFTSGRPPGTRGSLDRQMQQILARNQTALALMKQAGARPRCRLPLRWDQSPMQMLVSHLGDLGICSRLLVADGLVAAQQGDAARVTEACRAVIRMSRHMASEPLEASFSRAANAEASLATHLPDLLQDTDLDPATCQALARELDGLDFDTSFRNALVERGCVTLWLFDALKNPSALAWGDLGDGLESRSGPVIFRAELGVYKSPLGGLLRLKEEIEFLDTFDETMALAPKPYRVTAPQWRALEQRIGDAPSHHFITRATVPFGGSVLHGDYAVAYRNAMQVILALKAYHAKYGAYPNTLAALRTYPGAARAAPETQRGRVRAWPLPTDPFSGNDFVYRRHGTGFLLYSWGEDLDDDGGRPIPKYAGTFPPDGDIVWTFGK
jgi:hypothetical protein